MAEVIHDDKMLIYFFQDSLSGSSLSWYMRLENVKIKKWKDLVEAFLKQYKFNLEIAPDRTSLMSMEKRSQGVCTEMEGRGNTCPTSFNRNTDGDFICQYF
jgi:predicted metal-dependent hydrolase